MYTRLGSYVLVREAGRGGMSTVFEAVDTRIGRTVAVKVLTVGHYLSPEQNNDLTKRLSREARTVGSLSHPNIVTIYDVGEEDGHHFIVMEYLDGMTLRERITQGPVSPPEISQILDQVADGLDAVHARGVVHRDLKPSNVMLLPGELGTGEHVRVKLMDFGIARQADDTTITHTGVTAGSPAYMSPEQVRGEAGTPASDLWSLGVLLYEMLAGAPPFASDNIPSVLYKVNYENPAPLTQAEPQMQKILQRALEKEPAKRYGSARELAAAFRETAQRPTVTAAPSQPLPVAAGGVGRRPAKAPISFPSNVPRLGWAVLLLVTLLAAAPFVSRRRPPRPPATLASPAVLAFKHTQQPIDPLPSPSPERTHRAHRSASLPERDAKVAERARLPGQVRQKQPDPETTTLERRQQEGKKKKQVRAPEPRQAVVRVAKAPSSFPAPIDRNVNANKATPAPIPPAGVGQTRLLGTWHGRYSRQPATLAVTRHRGDFFAGTMTVNTSDGPVAVAVEGTLSADGWITLRETRVIRRPSTQPWGLGQNKGFLDRRGRMTGMGKDVGSSRIKVYGWEFSR